ncbi:MAG: hypothetical protein KDD70_02630 [Bdellovibrionales bacterium]|nr:hypothetical protein [Bdellovibrionales bacterium]
MTNWLTNNRLWIFILLAIGVLSITAFNGRWGGDFWIHAAVVRELSSHLFDPRNPLLSTTTPDALFSPYAIALGWGTKILGISNIEGLLLGGILNLIVFFLSFTFFFRELKERSGACFYSLICMFLLWGEKSWFFSGFLDLRSFSFIFPYPSFFAIGLVFFMWGCFLRYRSQAVLQIFLVVLLLATVLLTHPFTALGGGIGLLSLAFCEESKSRVRSVFVVLCSGIVGLGLASCWSYYPFLALILEEFPKYREFSSGFIHYEHVLKNTWPAFLGAAILLVRLRDKHYQPFSLMFAGALLLYLLGYVAGVSVFGRLISFVMLMAHCGMGCFLAEMEEKYRNRFPGRLLVYSSVVSGCILLVLLFDTRTVGGLQYSSIQQYQFLSRKVGAGDAVVMTDLLTGNIVPAFSGKVIAAMHPPWFVEDFAERRDAVESFFSPDTSIEQRRAILEKFQVKFVLYNAYNLPLPREAVFALLPLGKLVYSDDYFLLLAVTAEERIQQVEAR